MSQLLKRQREDADAMGVALSRAPLTTTLAQLCRTRQRTAKR